MGKTFDAIDDALAAWLAAQRLFFVATAPLAADAHVNVSPKGLDSFALLGPREVAYLDLTGSGAETIAHLRENGRVTLMFCAFQGPPRIVRLYGRGVAVLPGDDDFEALVRRFPAQPGVRSVIRIALRRIADSCGYAVPIYRFERDREQLAAWCERKGEDGLRDYRAKKNAVSIDGLPALPRP